MLQAAPTNASPGALNDWLELSVEMLEVYSVDKCLWLSILCTYCPGLEIPLSGDVDDLIEYSRQKKTRHESNAIFDIVLDNSKRAIRAQNTVERMMSCLSRRIISSPDGDFHEYMSKRFLLINQLTTNERQRQALLLDGIRGAARERLFEEFPNLGQMRPPQLKAKILGWADARGPSESRGTARPTPQNRPEPPAAAPKPKLKSKKLIGTAYRARPSLDHVPTEYMHDAKNLLIPCSDLSSIRNWTAYTTRLFQRIERYSNDSSERLAWLRHSFEGEALHYLNSHVRHWHTSSYQQLIRSMKELKLPSK